jgi:hypothetical protein
MAYPIIELVTQNVEATLRTVRIANGYNVDLIVERELKFGNPLRDKLAVVMQQTTERVVQPDIPQDRVAYRQEYWVQCFVVESEDSSTPIDQRINSVRSDVEKALMVDPFRGLDSDGNPLAMDTLIKDPIPIVDDQGRWDGVTVVFDVFYRTLYSDPYERG